MQPMKQLLFLIFMLSATSVLAQPSKGIEQIAFDYFISKLDSIINEELTGYKFNTKTDKLYFEGKTSMFDDLVLGDFKTYVFTRKRFIDPGSIKERNMLLKCSADPLPIIANAYHFIVAESKNLPEDKSVRVALSNRYFHKGYYYVRFQINKGVALRKVFAYIKLDEQAHPVDWVVTTDFL
jgi:hypothetical protein